MALTPLAAAKTEIIDFSFPITYVDAAIVIPFPDENTNVWADSNAFQPNVSIRIEMTIVNHQLYRGYCMPISKAWIALLVTFVAVIISMWLIHISNNSKQDRSKSSIAYWTLYFVGMLTTQG